MVVPRPGSSTKVPRPTSPLTRPRLSSSRIGPADRADGDLEVVGEVALRRQPLAGLQPRVLDRGRQAVGERPVAGPGMAGELGGGDGHRSILL